MARMLSQLPLPLLPAGAAEIAPGVGLAAGDDGSGLVGVSGLVPSRRGPKGASKLTPQLAARIAELDAAGATLREIAAATGVSTFSVRNALGRVAARGQGAAAGAAAGSASLAAGDDEQRPGAAVPVLPDPVPRDDERALARWGLLGEGACCPALKIPIL